VKVSLNPMRDLAEARGLPVFAPEDMNSADSLALLSSLRPDLLMVCDYGQILSPACLSVPPLGGINLHASLLPKYRGAAPINWAILKGETETGVTVIHMTPLLDGGPCVAIRKTPIGAEETTAELEPRLAELGVAAVFEAIDLLSHWDRVSPVGVVQDQTLATKAPRLKKTSGVVKWERTATDIVNQVRGLKPWPGTHTSWLRADGEPLRLILDKVSLAAEITTDAPPGTVVAVTNDRLCVATGDGVLSLDRVQPAGKRVLSAAEFLNGYRVQAGEKLGSM
jgi:methionyl-tRNA formyltransferase